MGVGGRHGAWNGEECVQEMQPEPKGTIPTTAAKLFQPWPKRNSQEGRKRAGGEAASGRTRGRRPPGTGRAGPGRRKCGPPPDTVASWLRTGACLLLGDEALAAQVGPAICSRMGGSLRPHRASSPVGFRGGPRRKSGQQQPVPESVPGSGN